MYQVLKAVRSTHTLATCKALASSMKVPIVINREFHWKRKSKGENEEKKVKEDKTKSEEVKDEKKNIETKNIIKENGTINQTKEVKPEDVIKTAVVVENRDEIDQNHYDQLKQDFGIEEIDPGNPPHDTKVGMISFGSEGITLNDFFDNLNNRSKAIESFENGNFRPEPINRSDSLKPLILPAIPLPVRPIFPGMVERLTFCDRRTIQKLRDLVKGDKQVGLFLRKDERCNTLDQQADVIKKIDDIYNVGTLATIRDIRIEGTIANVVFVGKHRIQLEECVELGPPTLVKVKKVIHSNHTFDDVTFKAMENEVNSYTRMLTKSNPALNDYKDHFLMNHEPNNPFYFVDFAGFLATADRASLQRMLETMDYKERFEISMKLLSNELQHSKIEQQIAENVKSNMKDTERKFFLREQMKAIQKELGDDKDPKTVYIDKIQKELQRMKDEKVNPAAISVVEEELTRLHYTDIQSAEFSTIRNYLDWITCLPWNKRGEDQMNLLLAEKVLNEDHYGLKDVKDRILEFIAVGKLQGNIPGKVLCFVGPPGTGKTSIAKSIARALGREYFQFSVGGANDVSQIKGHRRTYVGSMPGKLIHCLKKTNVNNPLILIDEVDKISSSHQGDPASALLEVLDPNQNTQFVDNYLDVPFDLSKALFVCTANDISTIPQPLLDRMEVIRVSGYDYKEKLEISKNYLDRKARKATGLEIGKSTTPKSLSITDEAYNSLIRWYCREAGVRNLEKYIEKIYRKVAMRLAKMTPEEIAQTDFTIHEKDLEPYIGKKIFLSDRMYDSTPAGVVMGLAWTSMGGATLYIECQTIKPHPLDKDITSIMQPANVYRIPAEESKASTGHLSMTGQLGDVMKESIQIAYLNARHWMQKLSYSTPLYDSLLRSYNSEKVVNSVMPKRDDIFNILETRDIHMHLPEGATPKDGPSAGCAITTSLLSTALHRPIKQGLAMTGEISLNGKVLPVGGIKEKVMAARRAGIYEIILPAENIRDVNELPEYVKENLNIHYAKTYEDVLKYTELCPEIFN